MASSAAPQGYARFSPGAFGSNPPGPYSTRTPAVRSVSRDSGNWGCWEYAEFTHGIIVMGIPLPIASATNPTSQVSVMPSAHRLMVFVVAGATSTASAPGHTSGSWVDLAYVRLPSGREFSTIVDKIAATA